jgi:elongator complex protein 6
MASRIPHLLEPYLALPPEASLILLTNVLGASSNWLVLRFLYNILNSRVEEGEGETKVLLISFMRDLSFWKDGAKRLVSVSLI